MLRPALAVMSFLPMLAFGAQPAMAQAGQQVTAQRFAAVLEDAGHRQLVLQSAQATPAWAHLACAGARFAPVQQIAVYLPMVFDKNGEPVSGEWRESMIASGCGSSLTLNVLTQVTGPARLATGYLLPGSTIADPILQNAAQRVAVKAAGGVPAGCKAAFIADTEFAGFEAPDAAKQTGPWKEVWTLDLCGPPRRTTLHFAADATGVAISAVTAAAPQP